METEEWRSVAEAPAYEVSSRGRLRRIKLDRHGNPYGGVLKPGLSRGYARYILCVDGKHLSRSGHALVCAAFNGPKPSPEMHCAHRDGCKLNNTPSNLYWATPLENAADRERHGKTHRGPRSPDAIARLPRGDTHWARINPERVVKGESHYARKDPSKVPKGSARHNAKLDEHAVRDIRNTPRTFGSGRALSEKYGVTMALISAIRNRRAWSYLE